jgi:hypothetical protein
MGGWSGPSETSSRLQGGSSGRFEIVGLNVLGDDAQGVEVEVG